MDVFTVQISNWRVATERGVLVINSTVRAKHPLFAPTWDMVMGHKQGSVSDDEYRREYYALLDHRLHANVVPWQEFFMFNQGRQIALGCYCTPGDFCHRHLLVPMLGKLATHWKLPYAYFGEILP